MTLLNHPALVLIYMMLLAVLVVVYGEWRHHDMQRRITKLTEELNGRMTELIREGKALSRAEGKAEGIDEERDRQEEEQ